MDIVSWNVNKASASPDAAPAVFVRSCVPQNPTVHPAVVVDGEKLPPPPPPPAVFCFQEVKCTRDRILREGFAKSDSFYAFHACSGRKTGYSGVSTIAFKDDDDGLPAVPWCGQEGFLGRSMSPATLPSAGGSAWDDTEMIPDMRVAVQVMITEPFNEGANEICVPFSIKELRDMDDEGRVAITDHGMFILINAYFPRACDDEPVRYEFKKRFQQAIQQVVLSLTIISEREVILVGDLNICHKPIDHCDPANNVRENKLDTFGDTMGRRWMDALLVADPQQLDIQAAKEAPRGGAPSQQLVDLFRHFHATQTQAFTCWNTLIDARAANFGTRIDYVLVTRGLVPWFADCRVRADVPGSDHCPVVATMAAANRATGETLRAAARAARDRVLGRLDASADVRPPRGCSALWDMVRAAGAQTSLAGWVAGLKRKDSAQQGGESAKRPNTGAANATAAGGPRKQQPSVASFFKRAVASEALSVTVSSGGGSLNAEPSPADSAWPQNPGNDETRSRSSSSSSALEWKTLMTRPANPKCYHGEESKELRVSVPSFFAIRPRKRLFD
ncbi:DNA-(apurinic or apyrimidinic site) lyase 2 [Entophlyctis luteolus]|nr:DNA-(apurinic or apyrimidinic site) lyase 2 [Entophlyctis luteolus]